MRTGPPCRYRNINPLMDRPAPCRGTVTRISRSETRLQKRGWPGRSLSCRRIAEGNETWPLSVRVVTTPLMGLTYHVVLSCQYSPFSTEPHAVIGQPLDRKVPSMTKSQVTSPHPAVFSLQSLPIFIFILTPPPPANPFKPCVALCGAGPRSTRLEDNRWYNEDWQLP